MSSMTRKKATQSKFPVHYFWRFADNSLLHLHAPSLSFVCVFVINFNATTNNDDDEKQQRKKNVFINNANKINLHSLFFLPRDRKRNTQKWKLFLSCSYENSFYFLANSSSFRYLHHTFFLQERPLSIFYALKRDFLLLMRVPCGRFTVFSSFFGKCFGRIFKISVLVAKFCFLLDEDFKTRMGRKYLVKNCRQ